jgi:hypothetical protein
MTDLADRVIPIASMEAEEAVSRAIDQDALLDGEDPETPHVEDADHWISVYQELIDFKISLLNATHDEAAQLEHAEARHEATDVDGTLLRAELARFRRRLAFWHDRRERLVERTAS